jgi:hypothetical protein
MESSGFNFLLCFAALTISLILTFFEEIGSCLISYSARMTRKYPRFSFIYLVSIVISWDKLILDKQQVAIESRDLPNHPADPTGARAKRSICNLHTEL